jgi:phosphopantetheine adenylyltransferase
VLPPKVFGYYSPICVPLSLTFYTVRTLRKAYEKFIEEKDIETLVRSIRATKDLRTELDEPGENSKVSLKREDLHLVCFDFVWS